MSSNRITIPVVLTALAVGLVAFVIVGCNKAPEQDQSGKPAIPSTASENTPDGLPEASTTAVVKTLASDPYPLTTCPVSGEELGGMGEPIIYDHNGREIRFCCDGCISQFEADPAKFISVMDEQIIAQQLPDYPLDTCVVTDAKLGGEMGEPYNYVYNNKLVRFCCDGCIATFEADPAKYLAKLK